MFNMIRNIFAVVVLALALVGCTSVETGHVGVRVWPNGEIDSREIATGWAQTVWGDVRHYVANDITWSLNDLRPQTKDKSTLKDLDLTYTYSVVPDKIVDSVVKYKGRDAVDAAGVYYPLARYIENVMTNATTDVIATYDALEANQNREKIRDEILAQARKTLSSDGFADTIKVQQIFIKNLNLADSIVASATAVITAQNVLKAKEYEVQTASKEAERLTLLAANSKNLDYLKVEVQKSMVEALAQNKNVVYVIPSDLTSFMVGK